jgi:hypothetical protein
MTCPDCHNPGVVRAPTHCFACGHGGFVVLCQTHADEPRTLMQCDVCRNLAMHRGSPMNE